MLAVALEGVVMLDVWALELVVRRLVRAAADVANDKAGQPRALQGFVTQAPALLTLFDQRESIKFGDLARASKEIKRFFQERSGLTAVFVQEFKDNRGMQSLMRYLLL